MNAKPYPKYKASGVEWLGDVPEHWEVKRLKWVGEAIIGLTYSPDDVVNEGDGTLVLRSSNIQNGKIVLNDNVFVSSEIPRRLRTKPKDIVICTRNGSRALVGKTGMISEQESDLTFGAFTAVFRSPANDYMFYVFNSGLFSFQAGLFQTSTIFQLTNGTINAFLIPLPPKIEQKFIVDFLDERTGKLDGLLGKKRVLIGKLKEKRSALISRTVTKGLPGVASAKTGLSPNPKLKPSGIPWLGDIPEHWEVSPLKRKVKILSGGTPPSSDADCWEGDVEWFTPQDMGQNVGKVIENSRRKLTDEGFENGGLTIAPAGSILLSTRAPIGHVALTAIDSCCNQGCRLLVPRLLELNASFGYYLILASKELLQTAGKGTTFLELSTGALGAHWIPSLSLFEQLSIADFLDQETSKLDRMIQKVEAAIEKLTEYRTALITAAVTGKIDVRRIKS